MPIDNPSTDKTGSLPSALIGAAKAVTLAVAASIAMMAAPLAAQTLVERPPALREHATLRLGVFKGAYTVALAGIKPLLAGTNLDIEVSSFVRYADARTALVTGSLDLATIGLGDLLIALSQGSSDIVALTGLATSKRFMIVRKGVKVERWKDLVGKRVGVAPGSSTWFQFVAKLQDENVPYGRLRTSNIQGAGSNFLIALKHGDIDVALTWEPFESSGVVEGIAYWPDLDFSTSKDAGNDTGLIATRRAVLDSKRDAVRLVLWAFLRSEEDLRSDHAKYVAALKRDTGASTVVAERIADKLKLGGSVDATQLQRYAATFAKLGALPRDVSGDIPRAFDAALKMELAK